MILVPALFLRLHRLDAWPPIHVDEAIGGVNAIDFFHADELLKPNPYTHYLAASLLPAAIGFKLGGVSLETLRLVSVLYGVGAVVATFWAGSVFFGRNAGLFAALVLAMSHVAVAVSRLGGMENSQAVFLAALSFACYGEALKKGGRWWPAWGAVIGLGAYSYVGFRIVPIVIIVALLFSPRLLWSLRRDLAIAFVAFVIVAAPVIVRFTMSPRAFWTETSTETVIGNPQPFRDSYKTNNMAVIVREQFKHSFDYFIDGGNKDTQYGYRGPGFDSVTRALFFAGLIVAALRIRDLGYRTLLVWFGLGLFVGSALTESPPLVPRISMLLPPAALLCGAPLGQALDNFRGRLEVAVPLLALVLAAALFAPNYDSYFVKYTDKDIFWPWTEPNRAIGLYIDGLPSGARVYLFRTPAVWSGHPITDFLRRGGPGKNVALSDIDGWSDPAFDLRRRILPFTTGELRFIAPPDAGEAVLQVLRLCPESRLETRSGPTEPEAKEGLLYIALTVPDASCLKPGLP